jgi:hypothetical protein
MYFMSFILALPSIDCPSAGQVAPGHQKFAFSAKKVKSIGNGWTSAILTGVVRAILFSLQRYHEARV